MPSIAISVVGEDEGVERMLQVLDTALSPTAIAGFLGFEVGPYLERRARARFAGEGDDAVGQWAPLKPATVEVRETAGYGGEHPINRRTDELMNYITGSGGDASPEVYGASLIFPGKPPMGDLEDKVSIAQQGGGEYNTVPRPVLGLSEADLIFVLSALAFHIEGTGKVML